MAIPKRRLKERRDDDMFASSSGTSRANTAKRPKIKRHEGRTDAVNNEGVSEHQNWRVLGEERLGEQLGL
jgi:hypothetical protein